MIPLQPCGKVTIYVCVDSESLWWSWAWAVDSTPRTSANDIAVYGPSTPNLEALSSDHVVVKGNWMAAKSDYQSFVA